MSHDGDQRPRPTHRRLAVNDGELRAPGKAWVGKWRQIRSGRIDHTRRSDVSIFCNLADPILKTIQEHLRRNRRLGGQSDA